MTSEQIIFRLVLAALLGSIVGLERERLDWAAGLRTHMLVCLGAALFMIVSSFGFSDVLGRANVELDPSRVAAQVVSGIGFLGAGTIILRRDVILGLTTAASLWAVAAVGLAVGGGLYAGAVATIILIVLILAAVKPLELRLFRNRRSRTIELVIDRDASLFVVQETIEQAGIGVRHITVRSGKTTEVHYVEVVLGLTQQGNLLPLVDSLRAIPGVRKVSCTTA